MKNFIFVFIIPLTLLISCNKEEKINFDDSRSKIIDASEINNKLSKEKNIILRNATIIGDIDFTKSKERYLVNANLIKHTINSALTFYDCTFKGKIIAHKKNNKFRIIKKHTIFGKKIWKIGRASCRESVDLGGRRIIKKKKKENTNVK